jgi:acyl carrier protein
MIQEDIKERIRGFILKNFVFDERRSLGDDESLIGSGVIDSTGILELIAFLEEGWSITFADDELTAENFDTLDRITAFVTKTLARKAA